MVTRGKLKDGYFSGGRNLSRDGSGDTLEDLLDDLRETADVLYQPDDSFVTVYVDGVTGDDSLDGYSDTADGPGVGPKATINGALAVIPRDSIKDYFVKIAPGPYDEELPLTKHRGATINLIGSLIAEHSGTVSDYTDSGLNPVGFHQVTVVGFTFEASDDGKWLRFDFDDGTYELVKILTVIAAGTVEVGAARLSGKTNVDYEDDGIGGHTTGVHVVSEGVTVGGAGQYVLRALGSGPISPSDEVNFLGAFYSFFGIKFETSHTYGSALYINRALSANLFFACCSLQCPDYFSLYVAGGSFQIFVYPASGYLGTAAKAEYDRLTEDLFSNVTFRCGLYMKGSTHVYNSPTAWLNLRSTVHDGALYTGDWQSFSMLYPRDHGLVIKQSAGIALRVDDRGGLMIRGRVLVNGPVLAKALSDVSMTSDLTIEWRASTGGVPLRVEGGCRANFVSATFSMDNDEAGEACIEVESCPEVALGAVTITGAPTGVAPVLVAHSHLHFHGAFAAPEQDYGVAPAGGIVKVVGHSNTKFESTATGKNTNAGASDPLVVRTLSSVQLPASGYDLKDNADGNTVYLGSKGSGQAIPTSGNLKNDLVSNPTATEEMVAVFRD